MERNVNSGYSIREDLPEKRWPIAYSDTCSNKLLGNTARVPAGTAIEKVLIVSSVTRFVDGQKLTEPKAYFCQVVLDGVRMYAWVLKTAIATNSEVFSLSQEKVKTKT